MNTIAHLAPPSVLPEVLCERFFLGTPGEKMRFLNLRFRSRFAGRPPTSLMAHPTPKPARMHLNKTDAANLMMNKNNTGWQLS